MFQQTQITNDKKLMVTNVQLSYLKSNKIQGCSLTWDFDQRLKTSATQTQSVSATGFGSFSQADRCRSTYLMSSGQKAYMSRTKIWNPCYRNKPESGTSVTETSHNLEHLSHKQAIIQNTCHRNMPESGTPVLEPNQYLEHLSQKQTRIWKIFHSNTLI